jgi:hypothetical protein
MAWAPKSSGGEKVPGLAAFARRLTVVASYLVLSLAITGVWVHCARTEYDVDRLDVRLASGETYSERFCSIARLAKGRAFAPFVKRRLLPDLARGLAAVVPDGVWSPVRAVLADPASAPPWLEAFLRRQQWKPADCPVLCCAYSLIGCSVLGFMFACRWLLALLYDSPPWVADLAGGVLGVALLGAYGDWHFSGYPYDFPTAFVFTLTLAGMLARRWWFPLAFAAAAYSKETAVLLIPAFVLVTPGWRTWRFWGMAGLLAAVYAGVRGWLDRHYPGVEPGFGFWWLGRNGRWLASLLFSSWLLPFVAVGTARLVALRHSYPRALKRLCLLAVPLVGMALFKGWVEELRQYLEVLPVVGLLVFHWCLHEASLGHLLRPWDASCSPAAGAGHRVEARVA